MIQLLLVFLSRDGVNAS